MSWPKASTTNEDFLIKDGPIYSLSAEEFTKVWVWLRDGTAWSEPIKEANSVKTRAFGLIHWDGLNQGSDLNQHIKKLIKHVAKHLLKKFNTSNFVLLNSKSAQS